MALPTTDRKELLASLGLSENEKLLVRDPEKAKVRTGAAKGLLPGTPEQTVRMMAAIAMAAPEPELRDLAVKSGASLPESLVLSVAENNTLAGVLWFLYRSMPRRDLREKIYLNKTIPMALLVHAARTENDSDLLELLAGNQQKMTEDPEFPGCLLENESLSPTARARVEEFFNRTYARQLLLHHGHEVEEEETNEAGAVQEINAAALAADNLPSELMKEDEPGKTAQEDENQEDEEEKKTLYQKMSTMTMAEKIKLALLGNMEARKLLIKESNRMIKDSVLKNPRITESEIATLAGNKSTSEDLLRIIANNRTWMRNYSLKLLLVNNPKTPVPMAISLMTQLRETDVAKLVKSKDVAAAVQQQAKRRTTRKK